MSKEKCEEEEEDTSWTVGSHACLTIAKSLRAEKSKALNENQVVLYRLIGNDMPPLESTGQLSMNTLFALQHEPKELWNGKRRWILNRIFDPDQHDAILNMLYDHGYGSDDILDVQLNEDVLCSMPNEYERLLYTTNQNGARNAAYREALRDGFRWILIFDGNGFVTLDTWNSIQNTLREADRDDKRVVHIPMIRLAEPQSSQTLNEMTTLQDIIMNPIFTNGAFAEAQIAFRRDLLPHGFTPYDTRSGYGAHNKLDMLTLCGEKIFWHFDVVEGGPRLALLSQFWNSTVCYCNQQVGQRAPEIYDWHHRYGMLPGVHDYRWVQVTSDFRKVSHYLCVFFFFFSYKP